MKEPKHWNELTEQEKKDYKRRQWYGIIAQWMGIALIFLIGTYTWFNLESFKAYSDPMSYALSKYPGLSCTYQGGKVELVNGEVVIKKQSDSFGRQYQFQEIEIGGL